MIKTLSPYYVTTSWQYIPPLVATKYTLKIYIWQGHKINDVPSEATYEITINNAEPSNGDSKVNISRLINDYIEFECVDLTGTTSLQESTNQIWVRTLVYYYGNSGVLIDQAFHIDTQIALQGYGYGLSGENPDTPDNKILMTVGDYTMANSDNNGFFIVPIELDEIPATTPEIVITDITQDTGTDAIVTFTDVGDYDEYYILAEFVSSGVIAFVPVSGNTSPQTITLPSVGEWDVIMYGYDANSNTNVTSNTYNITLI